MMYNNVTCVQSNKHMFFLYKQCVELYERQ